MKREILFRGKRVKDGYWVEGDLLHICGGAVIYHGSKTQSEIKENSGACIELFESEVSVVDPETVKQFTGVLDKEGEKIFEGDIFTVDGSKTTYKCVFENFEWIGISKDGDKYGSYTIRLSSINKRSCHIIGNIHDNPKLLK